MPPSRPRRSRSVPICLALLSLAGCTGTPPMSLPTTEAPAPSELRIDWADPVSDAHDVLLYLPFPRDVQCTGSVKAQGVLRGSGVGPFWLTLVETEGAVFPGAVFGWGALPGRAQAGAVDTNDHLRGEGHWEAGDEFALRDLESAEGYGENVKALIIAFRGLQSADPRSDPALRLVLKCQPWFDLFQGLRGSNDVAVLDPYTWDGAATVVVPVPPLVNLGVSKEVVVEKTVSGGQGLAAFGAIAQDRMRVRLEHPNGTKEFAYDPQANPQPTIRDFGAATLLIDESGRYRAQIESVSSAFPFVVLGRLDPLACLDALVRAADKEAPCSAKPA